MTDSMELDLQRVNILQEVGGASWWIQLWTFTWMHSFLKEFWTFWCPLNCDYTQLSCVWCPLNCDHTQLSCVWCPMNCDHTQLSCVWCPLNCDHTQLSCVKQLLQQQSVCCNLTMISFHLTPHLHVTSGIIYNSLWHQHSFVMRLLFHFLMTSSVKQKTRSDIREKPEMPVMELIVRPEQYDIISRLSKSLSTIYIYIYSKTVRYTICKIESGKIESVFNEFWPAIGVWKLS